MTWWQALVQGIVEGITEYLPVSSTGHLILTQRAVGVPDDEAAKAYAICIQSGAILAVVGLYFNRFRSMVMGVTGRSADGLRLAINVAVGVVPAVILGLSFEHVIKEKLMNLWAITFAWGVGGVAILLIERRRRKRRGLATMGVGVDRLNIPAAVIIGLAQCLGMWPGVSRSLVTILAGLLVGLDIGAAVEFSFLLGVVTLLGATGHDAVKHGHAMMQEYSWQQVAIGFLAAAVAAAVTVEWMVGYLKKRGLAVFGWYRVVLAALVALLLLTHGLDP